MIKDEELKNLLLKILYNEDKISSLNELILEKIFLKKIIELNMFKELIDSEEDLSISKG